MIEWRNLFFACVSCFIKSNPQCSWVIWVVCLLKWKSSIYYDIFMILVHQKSVSMTQFTSVISTPSQNCKSLINSKIQYFKNNLNPRLFMTTLSVRRNVVILSHLPSVTPDDIISYCLGAVFSRLHRLLTLLAKIIDMHVYLNSALGWTFPLLCASLSNICPMVVWNQ